MNMYFIFAVVVVIVVVAAAAAAAAATAAAFNLGFVFYLYLIIWFLNYGLANLSTVGTSVQDATFNRYLIGYLFVNAETVYIIKSLQLIFESIPGNLFSIIEFQTQYWLIIITLMVPMTYRPTCHYKSFIWHLVQIHIT